MAKAKQRSDWQQTASLMALIANCHRDPNKGRVFTPNDFSPYGSGGMRRSGIQIKADNIEDLKFLCRSNSRFA